jgi:hypothetical protein
MKIGLHHCVGLVKTIKMHMWNVQLGVQIVANMASYAISSSLILVIHDNMIIGTNLIVLACLCKHF